MKTADTLRKHPRVMSVDDERELGNGVIVMLRDGYEYVADPGCGTRGFDSFSEALREVKTMTQEVRAAAGA